MKLNDVNEYNQHIGSAIEGWIGRERPARIKLCGKYCNVIPLDQMTHSQELFNILNQDNADSWTYLPYGPFPSHDEFKAWLEMKSKEEDTLLFIITDAFTNAIFGMCGYLRICNDHGVIEIGNLHFSKKLKRTRLATEAIYLMMSYVFDELLYRRCEWKCHNLNQPSKRAAKRFGFQFEGIFRQSNVFKDRNRDTAWFSVLDHEWPRLKYAFKRWLDPNNFDAHGQQIMRLGDIKS